MSDGVLRIERDESGEAAGVATIWLDQPGRPVVVLDHALVQVLDRTIDALPSDVRGLVLASASERAFVAGADLKTIVESGDDALSRYIAYGARVFGRLAELPYPTAAAINGAVLGGGLELAMHCDGLIGAPSATGKPYPVGLPEASLRICPGWGGTSLLPARIDPAEGIRRAAVGTPMNFDEAREAGLFDAVAEPASDLLPAAKRWVAERAEAGGIERDGAPSRWIGRVGVASRVAEALETERGNLEPAGPGRAVCEAVDAGLSRGWEAALETERSHLVRLRHTEEAKSAVEAFFAKSGKKS